MVEQPWINPVRCQWSLVVLDILEICWLSVVDGHWNLGNCKTHRSATSPHISSPVIMTNQSFLLETWSSSSRSNHQLPLYRLKQLSSIERQTIEDVERMIGNTRRPRIACIVDNDLDRSIMSLTHSRLGGRYAWPKGTPLPLGGAAFCLIQINLSDLPVEAREELCPLLPQKGLLQAFIRPNSSYGCDFDTHKGDGFRLVLHTNLGDLELSSPLPLADSSLENLPIGAEANVMMSTGVPIAFRYERSTTISSNDYRFSAPTLSVMYDTHSNTVCSKHFEEWHDERTAQLDGQEVAIAWLGGHPKFCEADIRFQYQGDHYESFLSFSSDGNFFQWGDMGHATFMVQNTESLPQSLAKAIYSWDCY